MEQQQLINPELLLEKQISELVDKQDALLSMKNDQIKHMYVCFMGDLLLEQLELEIALIHATRCLELLINQMIAGSKIHLNIIYHQANAEISLAKLELYELRMQTKGMVLAVESDSLNDQEKNELITIYKKFMVQEGSQYLDALNVKNLRLWKDMAKARYMEDLAKLKETYHSISIHHHEGFYDNDKQDKNSFILRYHQMLAHLTHSISQFQGLFPANCEALLKNDQLLANKKSEISENIKKLNHLINEIEEMFLMMLPTQLISS